MKAHKKPSKETVSAVMREMGRKSWSKAGKASAAKLTPEQRSERARNAARARENRKNK